MGAITGASAMGLGAVLLLVRRLFRLGERESSVQGADRAGSPR